ncbi:DUF72 domain-containing protein [Methanomassiliicoccus luminyensis]|uniref:DUF72 domain-containing protein n=1 Tax=Methanomassiliicoccus luminyensis TaxID=1080712 RepID=UPI00138AE975|nr:DUF72 domain-containing protein [Methanomassiliicoccus luminyensis]
MSVLIGCSGWSYEDWVGRFYPVALAKKKEEWLRYYASYFSTVEINSTFYHPPNEFMVNGWIKKGQAFKSFEYSVKMPQQVTHETLSNGEADKAAVLATAFEGHCIKPLADNGLFGSGLIQLSPSFRNGDGSIRQLRTVLEALDTDKYRYAVEFRHRSWLDEVKGKLDPPVAKLLAELNVANVIVDGPDLPMVRDITADHAYLRLHGRSRETWSDDEREEDAHISRSDYLYSEEELSIWKEAIEKLDGLTGSVRVYFNNNGRAKGAKNAFQLMDMMSIPHREKEISVQDQTTLGNFLMLQR